MSFSEGKSEKEWNFSENREQQNKDNRDYYEILGVDKNATQDDIKKARNEKAMFFHSDKYEQRKKEGYNGTKEDLDKEAGKINNAYDILSDQAKRATYDQQRQTSGQFEQEQQKKDREKEDARRRDQTKQDKEKADKEAEQRKKDAEENAKKAKDEFEKNYREKTDREAQEEAKRKENAAKAEQEQKRKEDEAKQKQQEESAKPENIDKEIKRIKKEIDDLKVKVGDKKKDKENNSAEKDELEKKKKEWDELRNKKKAAEEKKKTGNEKAQEQGGAGASQQEQRQDNSGQNKEKKKETEENSGIIEKIEQRGGRLMGGGISVGVMVDGKKVLVNSRDKGKAVAISEPFNEIIFTDDELILGKKGGRDTLIDPATNGKVTEILEELKKNDRNHFDNSFDKIIIKEIIEETEKGWAGAIKGMTKKAKKIIIKNKYIVGTNEDIRTSPAETSIIKLSSYQGAVKKLQDNYIK